MSKIGNRKWYVNPTVATKISDITQWHYDRNTIEGSDNIHQYHKLIQECGELSDNLIKNKDRRDDYGDIMTVLIGMMERDGYTVQECLEKAYEDIKDRKGTMINNVFVKEADSVQG
ncbi:MazG-like pyrophosphatase [Pseudoalteromonas phage HP1]|jgi:hypothetical protein|uniref:MazG-like pyrophosphatase n=1 Tax=Pseudoalteromonas phage HP1 TaxID=1357706 RepID=UPI0018AFCE1C|nr:MazG-like pyrophosphatase [Pseudoalteromonas phage HP1]